MPGPLALLDVDDDWGYGFDFSVWVRQFNSSDEVDEVLRYHTVSEAEFTLNRHGLDTRLFRHGRGVRVVHEFAPDDRLVLWTGFIHQVRVLSETSFSVRLKGAADWIGTAVGSLQLENVKTGVVAEEVVHLLTDYMPLSVDFAVVAEDTEVGRVVVGESYPAEIDAGDTVVSRFDSALLFDDFEVQRLSEIVTALCTLEFGFFLALPDGKLRFVDRSSYTAPGAITVVDNDDLLTVDYLEVADRYSYVELQVYEFDDFTQQVVSELHDLTILPGRREYTLYPSVGGAAAIELRNVRFEGLQGIENVGVTYQYDLVGHQLIVVSNNAIAVTVDLLQVIADGTVRGARVSRSQHTQRRGGRALVLGTAGFRSEDVDTVLDLYSRFYGQEQSVVGQVGVDVYSASRETLGLWLLDRVRLQSVPEGYVSEYFVVGVHRFWQSATGLISAYLDLSPNHFFDYGVVGTARVGEDTKVGL